MLVPVGLGAFEIVQVTYGNVGPSRAWIFAQDVPGSVALQWIYHVCGPYPDCDWSPGTELDTIIYAKKIPIGGNMALYHAHYGGSVVPGHEPRWLFDSTPTVAGWVSSDYTLAGWTDLEPTWAPLGGWVPAAGWCAEAGAADESG